MERLQLEFLHFHLWNPILESLQKKVPKRLTKFLHISEQTHSHPAFLESSTKQILLIKIHQKFKIHQYCRIQKKNPEKVPISCQNPWKSPGLPPLPDVGRDGIGVLSAVSVRSAASGTVGASAKAPRRDLGIGERLTIGDVVCYRMGPPRYLSWFITPITMVYGSYNYSYWGL